MAEDAGRVDRRSFLAAGAGLAAVGGMGGLLAACSSSSGGSSSGGTSAGRDGVAKGSPKRGGQLIFANEAEDNSFDPAVGQWDESGVNYARAVYDPLTIIAADGSVKPYLAESVTPNSDYTVWTIKARPGVTFHDGTVCDGPAIAGSMNHFLGGELGTVVKGPIDSIVATDSQTVTVNLKTPWVPFDYYLAGGIGGQIGYIVAPAFVAAANKASSTQTAVTPIGTGPFKYQAWVPNDHFTAVRNPNYWRPGLPYLDQVTYKPIPDPDQRANSLQAGTVNMMHTDVASVLLQYRDNNSYGYVDDLHQTIGEPDMDCILLNLSKAPFNDIRARQALAYAFNPAAYKQVINNGLNPTSNQPFVPGSPFYKPVNYPSYNLQQAKTLVQQYQRDTGTPLSFELGSTTSPIAVKANQLLQQEFQAAGMKVTLTQVQQDEFITYALDGKFQAFNWRQFGAVDPDLNYIFWSPTTIYQSLGLAVNMARNTDPQVETLLQQGRTSSSPSARDQAYQQIAARFAADLPYIWTDRAIWALVAQGKVQNFNNPTAPDGTKAYGMLVGTFFPTEIWVQ